MNFRITLAVLGTAALLNSAAQAEQTTPTAAGKTGAAATGTTTGTAESKVTTLPSGTKVEDQVVGTGKEATKGSNAVVHYTGTLTDGTKFDSSVGRAPFTVENLGNAPVIQGWNEGLVGMKVGGKRQLTIPPAAGYGARGTPGGPIPPNATLVFDIELLDVR